MVDIKTKDLVADGWTDILRKLPVRPKPGDKADPEALAVKRQLADFYKMEHISVRLRATIAKASLRRWQRTMQRTELVR
jgi:hypothetical protein